MEWRYSKYISWLIVFVLSIVFAIPVSAQDHSNMIIGKYPKARLFLYDGRIIQGKSLVMSGDSVSLVAYGVTHTFQLNEIQQIMVKKGHALLFGYGCGLGCLGLLALSYAVTGGEYEDEYGYTQKLSWGEYAVGSAIWVGLCAAGGYFLGYVFDDWAIVYYLPRNYEMRSQLSPAPNMVLSSYIGSNDIHLPMIRGSF